MHEVGAPFFGTAIHMGINWFPNDRDYIKNVIWKDPVFNMVNKIDWKGLDAIQLRELRCKQVLIYEKFIPTKIAQRE